MNDIDWTDRSQILEAIQKYNKIPFNKTTTEHIEYNTNPLDTVDKEQKKLQEEKYIKKQQEKKRRKKLEEFRGEYMDYHCASCDGNLKIVYTKWSTTHFAKAICETCDRFDRWIPHPKPDNQFK